MIHRLHERRASFGKLLFLPMILMLLTLGCLPAMADDDPVLNDSSYYEISTAAQLKWFATKVNAGDQSINGVLTADIDLSTLGEEYWTPIGSWSDESAVYKYYKGKFNGQSHTISGLVLRKAAASGLFGITEGATISNVNVTGAQMKATPDTRVATIQYGIAPICGVATAGTVIANCHSALTEITYKHYDSEKQKDIDCVGGIVGELRGSTAKDCTVNGFVRTDGRYVGGIVGAVNCGLVQNCHLQDYVNDNSAGNSAVVGIDFVGGIAGYLKNRSIENAIIDCTVADESMLNATAGQKGTICGCDTMFAEPDQFDGSYEIYNADQLKWFASQVNSGNTKINAKLMNDLNMSKAGTFSPIGNKSNPFAGEFNGQEFTIDSLSIGSQDYAGLFGHVKDGRVRNVTLNHASLNAGDNDYQGLIVGWLTQNSGNATCMSYIENCHVLDGNLYRGSDGEPQFVGGIVGKVDMSAEVHNCTFQGIVKAHEDYIGGIAGGMDSGAKMYNCSTLGPSTVWGDDYVGGVVGYMTDTDTKIDNCFANESNGQITVHASAGNYSGLVRGYDKSGSVAKTKYIEGNLQYEFTGKYVTVANGKQASELKITGTSTKDQGTYYAIADIGTSYKYKTTEIERLEGVKELYFWDNCSNIAGTEACDWIDMKIDDYAFDSNFETLKMCYKMFAGDDHVVMLRPTDVYPVGENMFANCPNAKVYVDAEYYDEFCNDSLWSKYKKYLVPVTFMRTEDVNALYGARYAYDRNRDKTGSIYKVDNGNVNDTYQVHVIGPDDSYINSNNGTVWIYQDLGETYYYNTTKIWNCSFKGKDNIKTVKFQEITKSGKGVSQPFHIEIGDSAFANCENLNRFEVALYTDRGDDHVELLSPSQMPIGKNVFGDNKNVKIYVGSDLVYDFKNDTTYGWGAYKDMIYAGEFGNTNFTEAGVIYSYYASADGKKLYTNSDNAKMEELLAAWNSRYQNFSPAKVLVYNVSSTVRYMTATGIDKDKIDNEGGVLKFYNDIGESKHYKTIAISASGFQNQTSIKSITFEDIVSNNYNTVADFSLAIPDRAFEGCSQLKELNMFMYVTKGTNHYEGVKPSQVYIGEHVFDGADKEFRIKVLPAYYNDFINDPNWSKYKDYIVSCEYLPTGKKAQTIDDVTYDYASYMMNAISTNQLTQMKSSWVNAIIVVAEVAAAAVTFWYSAGIPLAINGPSKAISLYVMTHFEGYWGLPELTSVATGAQAAAAQAAANAAAISVAGAAATLEVGFIVSTNLAGKERDEYVVENWTPVNYLINRTKKNFERPATWTMSGQWVSTEQIINIPRMYVKSVADKETITIYNDIGEDNDDYQTVGVAYDAFHNKKNLKTIKFQERKGTGSRSLASGMILALPDSMFVGSDNFELLDLINYTTGAHSENHAYKSLTPDNFIPMGDIFAGIDTTNVHIRVGKDVLNDFLEDDYWSKYKSMFIADDVAIVNKQTEWSCKYALAYDRNTLPLRHTVSTHDIDHVMIYGADETLYTQNEGLAALINDFGEWNNYKLDYVMKGAFKGNEHLKILDICDTHTNIAKVYTAFDVILQDSAFAHCPNFTDLNLIYQVTVGSNHTESMSPSQFILGDGVFYDTPKLKIKFCLDQEEAFTADTAWVKYKNKFAPCFFEPLDEKVGKLLLHPYRFLTKLNDGTNFEHVDATRAKPEELKTLFKGSDIESFDEFRAFASCGLTEIYDDMFSGCSSLQTIMLPDSVTTIGSNAFKNCSLLRTLTIPAKVTSIKENAFTGSGINTFTMKSSTPAEIEADKVFAGLTDSEYVIYVPDSTVQTYKTKWAAVANHINGVSQRRGLKVVTLTEPGTLAEKLGLEYDYTLNPFLNNHLKGNYAQYDSLRIIGPIDGRDIGVIRYMGGRDVEYCEPTVGHLKYLDLYEADIKKGYEFNRASYEDWFYEDYVDDFIRKDNEVSPNMFYGLDKLETLILPKSATEICYHAMRGCTNLKYLVIGDNVSEIEEDVAGETDNKVALVMLSKKVPEIPYYAFTRRQGTSHHGGKLRYDRLSTEEEHFNVLIVPDGTINDYTSNAGLTQIADSVLTNFEDEALVEALKKQHVFSPIDLLYTTDITGWMNGNDKIERFNELMYSQVTKLDDKSFTDMKGLREVALPYLLTKITKDAFKGCSSLQTIYAFGYYIPELAEGAFNDLPTDFVIMVPEGLEEQYRAAWPEYKDHIQGYHSARVSIREVTLTEPNTLVDSLGAKITMKNDMVVAVGGNLSDITGLKVSGPIGGKDLALIRYLGGREPDWNGHVYTTKLEYLDLYDAELKADKYEFLLRWSNRKIENDNEIPKDMLWNCDNLKTVILPRTATKLEYEACYDMASLERLVIGDNTTEIEDDALGENRKLTDIIFLCSSKPKLDSDAFTDPIEGANRRVERMYVRKELVNEFSHDDQYTGHANQITSVFGDINQFRAFGCKAIASKDDLSSITNIDGWFKQFTQLSDLGLLDQTNLVSLGQKDLSTLSDLKHIALPSTLTSIDKDAFKENTNLHWVDLSACDSLKIAVDTLGVSSDALVYVPALYVAEGQTNVVYGTGSNKQCDNYYLVATHDYDVPKAFTAKKVTLGREFEKDKYKTITLPFSTTTLPIGFRAYEMNTDKNQDGEISFKSTNSLKANIPYVVKAKQTTNLVVDEEVTIPVTPLANTSVAGRYYSLFGNMQTISSKDAHEMSMLAMNDSTCLWNIVNEDSEGLAPFTAYVQKRSTDVTTSNVKSVFALWHYYIGDNEYDLDGDNTEDSPLCCDNLKLEDGLDFKADEGVSSFTAANATYTRTMNSTWGTLCLPYAIDASVDNATCYFYTIKENTGDNLSLTRLHDVIPAGTPILVQRRKAGTDVVISVENQDVVTSPQEDATGQMSGSFQEMEITDDNAYIISNDHFWNVGYLKTSQGAQAVKIKGFRTYILSGDGESKLNIGVDDETTVVDRLNSLTDSADTRYYDAQGRQTNGLQRGLNIVRNGNKTTKVLIK